MPTIDPKDAAEYFRLHAEHAALEKQLKPLKEKLLQQLIDGAASPSELPLLLVNRPQKRALPNWRDVCLSLLKKIRSKKSAEDRLQEIENGFPSKDVPALHVIPNPGFIGKAV